MDGEHPRLEVHSEPVGDEDGLLPLLYRRLEVHLPQVLDLTRLEKDVEKSLKSKCLTQNYEKTTWTTRYLKLIILVKKAYK